jgi:hypothetical protein
MKDISENIKPKGHVEAIIENKNGEITTLEFPNTILDLGRNALAKSLANDFGDAYEFFISKMLFGDGGTTGGVPILVDSGRTGLFGVTRANKSVISTVNPDVSSQAIFTSVLKFDEANGFTLNELALQMRNGDLFSLVTFEGIGKTSSIQVTFNWRLNFV